MIIVVGKCTTATGVDAALPSHVRLDFPLSRHAIDQKANDEAAAVDKCRSRDTVEPAKQIHAAEVSPPVCFSPFFLVRLVLFLFSFLFQDDYDRQTGKQLVYNDCKDLSLKTNLVERLTIFRRKASQCRYHGEMIHCYRLPFCLRLCFFGSFFIERFDCLSCLSPPG